MIAADYCECTECQSVLSPSAYLVDLLHNFLDSVPANALYSVLGVLTSRRPDLLFLKLNCANAELPLPYIDLVNEILEACVVYKVSLPHQLVAPFDPLPNNTSADAGAEELSINPEHTNAQAYAALQNAVYPGNLPFNLWLETLRTCLVALGTSRWELASTFHTASSAMAACEALGFSGEERAIVSTRDTAGTPLVDPHSVNDYFGGVGGVMFPLYAVMQPVPRFLRFAGIEFDQLLDLLKTRHVNPVDAAPADRLLIDTSDPCNLDAANMMNLRADEQLGHIHRFLRLWRKRGGSMFDLDRCLHAFGAVEIDDTLLIRLADAQRLANRLNRKVVDLLPFWSALDTYVYDDQLPPYHALFLHKTVSQPISPCFALTVPPAAPELAGAPGCTMTVSAHLAEIQGALRLRASDLKALADGVLTNDKLNLANLSSLHRHALLARAIQRPVTELLSMRQLHAEDPFATPDATSRFIDVSDAVRASGFTVAQMDYLYRDLGSVPAARSFVPWLTVLTQGLARIQVDNTPVPDPYGTLTRKKLMLLYDPGTVERVIGLIQSASVWRTTLADMPALAEDTDLRRRLLYQPASQTLQFAGAMSTTERDALLAGQPPAFQSAIQDLWQQPRSFIDATLTTFPRSATDTAATPFLDTTQAKTVLLDATKTAVEKFAFVLAPLLRFLTMTLTHDLAAQTLAAASKIDPQLARWLLQTGLSSPGAVAGPAMTDFLEARGVDARYFAGTALAGPALVRAAPRIDFDWGAGSPDPAIPPAGFGARWSAMLQAPDTSTYTLHVLANDGVRLWVDGNLLIDDWKNQPAVERSASVELKKGQFYELSMEYFQATAAQPAVRLMWSHDGMAKDVVPAEVLHPLDHWRRFHKAALLARTFGLSAPELGYLSAHAGDFGGFDLNRLPLHPSGFDPAVSATWARLWSVVRLRNRLALEDGGIAAIFGAPSRNEAVARLALTAGWDAAQIAWLTGPAGLNLADADFRTEARLAEVAACFALADRTGTSVQQLAHWAAADMAGPDAQDVAAEVRKALKAHHDDASWVAVGKGLNDPLRSARRDALVSFLLAHPDRVDYTDTDPFLPRLATADDLYEYLLIDVQMDPCMLASRTQLAIASVQQFVQRCLLGLEAGVAPTALSAAHWAWMQHYRVWEAGRKVFMWPENWIEAPLRDDKTVFFKELETDLLKNELSADNVESAFTNYLHKLEAIARPEIMGMYVEDLSEPQASAGHRRVHVVARTRSAPHEYFYRYQEDGARWTAWDRVPADIEGDSVIPVVWERRCYIFWPMLVEKAHPAQGAQGSPARKYWEIRFAYIEMRSPGWTPKRVLDTPVALEFHHPTQSLAEKSLSPSNFLFKAIAVDGRLMLQVLVRVQIDPVETIPDIVFVHELAAVVDVSVCDGETRVSYASGTTATAAVMLPDMAPAGPGAGTAKLAAPASTNDELLRLYPDAWTWHGAPGPFKVYFGFWDELGDMPDASGQTVHAAALLGFAPGDFKVVAPHQYRQFDQQAPFFYQDSSHTYFVEPRKRILNTPMGDAYDMDACFFTHQHPFVCFFLTELQRAGIDGILGLATQGASEWGPGGEFAGYNPEPAAVVPPYPQSRVEFDSGAAYAIYNWELFFHAPLLIASALHQDRRFADADRWLRHIFDPNSRSDEAAPKRFWNFAPFHLNDPADAQKSSIQKLLLSLDDQTDPVQTAQIRQQLRDWADDPFNPHRIARMRPVAFQNAVVMKYIDNLIAWGDQLFTEDTRETINEATQLYVLAAKVMGQRPRALPPMAEVPSLTYVQLGVIDEFANALEDALPLSTPPGAAGPVVSGLTGGLGVSLLPYFCVPPNPMLLERWDTIADRLYKLRHCRNIEGVVRSLPLYDAPIDAALLVRASAMGVDIASVLSDLDAAMPCYRFGVMLQKALELCAMLKALGAALLAALEKQDAEALAVLRAGHETALLDLVRGVKQSQLFEAQRTREGLDKTWELTENRRQFYEAQLAESGSGLSGHEQEQQKQLDQAQDWQAASQVLEAAAGTSHAMPNFTFGESGMASPVATALFGGNNLGNSLHAAANVLSYVSSVHGYWANEAALQAGWERRSREWTLQMQTAAKELEQIDKQRLAADLRIDIGNQEIANHQRQLDNSREIEAFYRDKYTSRQLYDWMVSELCALYFGSYQAAYELAKVCERAYRFELGLINSDFIRFGVWDSLKKGLLAGERLEGCLRQMEHAYLQQNRREYEITKQVSLLRLEPLALISLKQAGWCEFEIPESLFDADYPGHIMRRLKSVSISMPCVVGPYASINATLTLLNNRTRVKSTPAKPYEENLKGDARFVANFAAIQSIATSHGQADNGLFELSFRDERYLPFEGAGAISRWRIELSRENNAFDVNTLSDVILHLKYTSRDGGPELATAASSAVKAAQSSSDHPPLAQLISARRDFPEAWHAFCRPWDADAQAQLLHLTLDGAQFPYRYAHPKLNAFSLSFFLLFKNPKQDIKDYKAGARLRFSITVQEDAPLASTELACNPALYGDTPCTTVDLPEALSLPLPLTLSVDEEDIRHLSPALVEHVPATPAGRARLNADLIDDLVMVVHYSYA